MGVPSRLGKVGVLGSATSTQNYADFEIGRGTPRTLPFGVTLCLSAHLNGYKDRQFIGTRRTLRERLDEPAVFFIKEICVFFSFELVLKHAIERSLTITTSKAMRTASRQVRSFGLYFWLSFAVLFLFRLRTIQTDRSTANCQAQAPTRLPGIREAFRTDGDRGSSERPAG